MIKADRELILPQVLAWQQGRVDPDAQRAAIIQFRAAVIAMWRKLLQYYPDMARVVEDEFVLPTSDNDDLYDISVAYYETGEAMLQLSGAPAGEFSYRYGRAV